MRLLLLAFALTSCATHAPTVPPAEKHRGMSYACAYRPDRDIRYGSPASAESLRELKELGVNWISITPFGFHRGGPEISWGGERVWETDESLAAVTEQAHALGIKVLLKPHVWGRRELDMRQWDAAQWSTWFDHYTRLIEHYATIARDAKIDAFCIGNEQKVASSHESEWRAIIGRIRGIYRGPITYGANFDEVFDVKFWDAVDWIGVSAYFPLADERSPDRATLARGWAPIVGKLEALALAQKKQIVFTEIGYRSADGAAWRQWELPRDAPLNVDVQAEAYEAFFDAVWTKPWLGGAYPWKWYSYPNHSGPRDNDYFIDNKPAEAVIRQHYQSAR